MNDPSEVRRYSAPSQGVMLWDSEGGYVSVDDYNIIMKEAIVLRAREKELEELVRWLSTTVQKATENGLRKNKS